MPEIALYLGAPDTGKSYLANARVKAEAEATGLPVLLVDGAGTSTLPVPRVGSWAEAARCVWGSPRTSAGFVAETEESLEGAAGAAFGGRDCILLLDEVGLFMSDRYCPPVLERLLRLYRHRRVSIHLITQVVADIAQAPLTCANRCFAFCNDKAGAVDRLVKNFPSFDPARLPQLKQREFLEWRRTL